MSLSFRASLARLGGVLVLILLGGGQPLATELDALVAGRQTSQPIGHYEFCKVSPAECAIRPRDNGPLHLSQAVLARISETNRTVNRAVRPLNDIDIYGRDEVWTYPDVGAGDCEDYALEKRRRLNRAGISLSNLLITVVRKPDGEGHAVLTVRTDRGDFILDNLNDEVRSWRDTGYRFLKRQASYHTGRWVSLRDERSTLVGSVSN
ncbi:MAG: transglutaminase-like cysteine peptidase [Rhizobiaceae bacterium]|nr:transglutaminase-like cysteine peptidase [Rhizobiaceae bacterium]